MIQRYDVRYGYLGDTKISWESPDGDWCRWPDVEKLIATAAALRKCLVDYVGTDDKGRLDEMEELGREIHYPTKRESVELSAIQLLLSTQELAKAKGGK